MEQVRFDLDRLKGAMHRRQKEVAKKIGLSPMGLSYKLNGKRPLLLEELNDICCALGRSPREFIVFEIEKAA